MLPGVAPVAIQQGNWVAETIARDLENQPRGAFHYHDKGSLATIGRAAAVAQFRQVLNCPATLPGWRGCLSTFCF